MIAREIAEAHAKATQAVTATRRALDRAEAALRAAQDAHHAAWRTLQACDQLAAAHLRDITPKARLDPEGTAKPLTRIVGHVRPGDCIPLAPQADLELEDTSTGERTPLGGHDDGAA